MNDQLQAEILKVLQEIDDILAEVTGTRPTPVFTMQGVALAKKFEHGLQNKKVSVHNGLTLIISKDCLKRIL